jgi:hypothetical protein
MRNLFTSILVLALLSSASVWATGDEQPGDDDERDLESAVEEILNRPIEEGRSEETQRCITRTQYRSVEVLDEQRIVFIGRGGRLWLNQLRTPCSGLTNRQALQIESSGMRLCRLDSFYGLERTMMSAHWRTSRCLLGEFEPISEEQLQLLKEALNESGPRRVRDDD